MLEGRTLTGVEVGASQHRTLSDSLVAAAATPRGVHFLDASERATFLGYAELHRRALTVARSLEALGIAHGERVGLVLPTGPDFFDAFFGCILAGIVPVPLYPPVRLGRLSEYHERTSAMLRAVDAQAVLTDARVRRILGPTVEGARPPKGCLLVDSLRGDAPERPPLEAGVRGDDIAFIQFSSGTTGTPKPVVLTHAQILANVVALTRPMLAAWPESDDLRHVAVSWLPLYHDMGLVGGVLTAMAHPVDLVLLPPELFVVRPASWLRAISKYRGTISPAPNFAYALCSERVSEAEIGDLDLSSWRVALNGAEPVTPAVLERFVARFGACGLRPEAVTPVYGLAEATLAVTFSDLANPFRGVRFDRSALAQEGRAEPAADGHLLVSVGSPLEGFAVRIIDERGHDLADGRVGEVLVRGPSVMAGYHEDAVTTARTIEDGWLRTGDTGFAFGGELFLYGRAKDILVLRGRKYGPQDVEQALDGLEGVRAGCSAAVGVVGEEGEELLVFVERAAGTNVDDRALGQAAQRRVVERTGLVPADVVLLEPGTLPRTSSGKIRRSEARRLWSQGSLLPPEPVNAFRMAGAVLRSAVAYARVSRGNTN